MERYNEYKDSGVQWLGEIPSHWAIMPLKYSGRFCKGKLPSETNENCLGKPIIGASEMNGNMPSVYSEDNSVPQCTKNDILFLWDGANAGLVSFFHEGIVASTVTKFTCDNSNIVSTYLYYLEKNYQRYYKERVGGTTIPHMNSQYIASCPLLIPSTQEQQAIAFYLDTATAKIDEAIAQQQKMIDLLNERKQIIINNAVTKGLNPDAPMKDSGVDWIGKIPEHWEVLRIRYIGESKNGLTYSPNDMVDEGNGILVLRSSNIQDGKLAFEDNVYVKGAPEKLWVKKGDIIICSRNGSASLVGKCAIVEEDIYASFGAFMMRFRSEHNSKYTYYLLTAAISHYKQLFATSTINQLTLGIFADIKMPFVYDLQEQTKIAESLDLAIQKLDTAISNATNQISLLQERKQIIINDVVTGKVKVS